ncbi:flagellar export protein FliJ [Thalassotalea sp. M1531]|uniref:Flagellar FliJ protein n=1 Tax=Thalassotalea algicola TaxID=2716224 RepID=A0A7Y0Q977_9GAMM|nr:flagellar export protein FliJ [Thalassotalea algicola]NMP32915.1 flagellar export protein FliJ [Thalassotalea algicola]
MARNQLDTLYRFEKDKEAKAAQQLQAAELDYQQNLERLKGVGEYRLEYMRRLSERSKEGVDSSVFNHFHSFVNKLDQAGEQVKIAIEQSKAMMEKRKQQWLMQRQKVQAVEHLREIQLKKEAQVEMRKEQKMFDEIATQQFIRRAR